MTIKHMTQQAIYSDYVHFIHNFLKPLQIETMRIYSSFTNTAFLQFLLQYTPITFFTEAFVHGPFSSRFKPANTSTSYVYIHMDTPETNRKIIEECIQTTHPKLIITTIEYSNLGYNSIPFSPGLYFTFQNDINVEYLPNLWKPYQFNMTTICHKDGRYTTHRTNEDVWYAIRASDSKFTKSDLEIVANTKRRTYTSPTICREDMRWFVYEQELYGSYTRIDPYISGVKTHATLSIGKFNNDLELVEEIVPQYGGNLTNDPEKNWTFWEGKNGTLQCVYTFTPFKMLEFSNLHAPPKDITIPCELPDLIRGGAAGVIYNNQIWCFTHVFVDGQMNVGVVVLTYDTVPRVIGYCNTLIEAKECRNLFFYICGAYLDIPTISWKLTGGAQDTQACIITLPHTAILPKIIWL